MPDPVRLSGSFGLYLTLPFNCGFAVAYAPGPERLHRLHEIAAALNAETTGYVWRAEPLTAVPSLFLAKGGVLVGVPQRREATQQLVARAFASEAIGAALVGEVVEEVVYFDHGVGSVTVSIEGVVDNAEALPRLQQLATRLLADLESSAGKPKLLVDWPAFRATFRDALARTGDLYDCWGMLASGGDGRGRIMCVGNNAFVRAELAGPLVVDRADLVDIVSPFAGLEADVVRNLAPLWPGAQYVACGWEGQIAIVNSPQAEHTLRWCWQFAANYWALITDLDAYIYQQTLESTRNQLDPAQAQRAMVRIQCIELAIDILTHESLPNNFGDQGHEVAIYKAIYESWETDRFLVGIKEKFAHLSVRFAALSAVVSNRSQQRMNVVMLVFTVLTFASVIADVVSAIDSSGTLLDTRTRVFLIVFGVLSATLLATFSFLLRDPRRSSERHRVARVDAAKAAIGR